MLRRYVFPGIGLATSISGASEITDGMLYRAAVACMETMTEEEIAEGRTFPNIKRIREVSLNVAVAVIEEALRDESVTVFKLSKGKIRRAGGLRRLVASRMYYPRYHPLVPPDHF